jgi:hypothetical protein
LLTVVLFAVQKADGRSSTTLQQQLRSDGQQDNCYLFHQSKQRECKGGESHLAGNAINLVTTTTLINFRKEMAGKV